MTLEETEKLIAQLRKQASCLNNAADALEASLMPLRVIKDAQDKFLQTQKELAELYGFNFFDPTKFLPKS